MRFTVMRSLCLMVVTLAVHGCGKQPMEVPAPSAPKHSGVSVDAPADNPAPLAPVAEVSTPAEPARASEAIPVDPGIQAALAKFFADNARPAQNWKELQDGRYISRIPQGTDGKPLDWDKTMQEIGKRR